MSAENGLGREVGAVLEYLAKPENEAMLAGNTSPHCIYGLQTNGGGCNKKSIGLSAGRKQCNPINGIFQVDCVVE